MYRRRIRRRSRCLKQEAQQVKSEQERQKARVERPQQQQQDHGQAPSLHHPTDASPSHQAQVQEPQFVNRDSNILYGVLCRIT